LLRLKSHNHQYHVHTPTDGFLFDGFEADFWWWSVLIMSFQKSILVVLVTVFGSQALQLMAAVAFLTFMLALVGLFTPYKDNKMDIVEFLSFVVVWMFAMSGVFQFVSPAEPQMTVTSLTLSILCAIFFISFTSYLVTRFLQHDPGVARRLKAAKALVENKLGTENSLGHTRNASSMSKGGHTRMASVLGFLGIGSSRRPFVSSVAVEKSDRVDEDGDLDGALPEPQPTVRFCTDALPSDRALPSIAHALSMPMNTERSAPVKKPASVSHEPSLRMAVGDVSDRQYESVPLIVHSTGPSMSAPPLTSSQNRSMAERTNLSL
jgi:hypothetical protein